MQLVVQRPGALGRLLSEDPALATRVQAATDALAALDHWGVPVFVVDGELFWGQDRLDEVERALSSARDPRP